MTIIEIALSNSTHTSGVPNQIIRSAIHYKTIFTKENKIIHFAWIMKRFPILQDIAIVKKRIVKYEVLPSQRTCSSHQMKHLFETITCFSQTLTKTTVLQNKFT